MPQQSNKPYVWILRQDLDANNVKITVKVSVTTPGGLVAVSGNLVIDTSPPGGSGEGGANDKHLKFELQAVAGAPSVTYDDEKSYTVTPAVANSIDAGVIVRIRIPTVGEQKPIRGKVKANYASADTDSSGGGNI